MCSYTHLSEEHRRARKDYHCAAGCGVPIPVGTLYVTTAAIIEGDFSSDRWHVECREAFGEMLRENGDDCGDPWDTWENGMPAEIAAHYIHGPFEEAEP